MKKRLWMLIPLIALAACGSADTPSSGDKACQDFAAKLAECHLTTPGTCNTSQPCAVSCAANAECAQLLAPAPMGTYLACVAACSGAGPNDFICKDGRGFVNKAGLCDGKYQCQDGSDEANCGSSDGGTD